MIRSLHTLLYLPRTCKSRNHCSCLTVVWVIEVTFEVLHSQHRGYDTTTPPLTRESTKIQDNSTPIISGGHVLNVNSETSCKNLTDTNPKRKDPMRESRRSHHSAKSFESYKGRIFTDSRERCGKNVVEESHTCSVAPQERAYLRWGSHLELYKVDCAIARRCRS